MFSPQEISEKFIDIGKGKADLCLHKALLLRSEEHTSELQSQR